MSEENPYQAPAAEVIEHHQQGERTLIPAKACGAGSGWGWISEAFSLFARSPWIWILVWLVLIGYFAGNFFCTLRQFCPQSVLLRAGGWNDDGLC